MKVYLSGGMEYADGEGAHWRRDLQAWLGEHLRHDSFNPNVESERFFSLHHPGVNIRELKFEDINRYQAIIRHLVDIDCREIAERSDYVVCFWDQGAVQGAGTKGELTMARFFGKPVYLVTQIDLRQIPGWVLGCTTEVFPSFDALKTKLLDLHGK